MSNPTYHVGCGFAGIYAGTLKPNGIEWRNKTDVTDEALEAVRDYLSDKFLTNGREQGGYSWTRKDGKKVVLQIMLED